MIKEENVFMKRFIATAISFVMVLTMNVVSVFAEDNITEDRGSNRQPYTELPCTPSEVDKDGPVDPDDNAKIYGRKRETNANGPYLCIAPVDTREVNGKWILMNSFASPTTERLDARIWIANPDGATTNRFSLKVNNIEATFLAPGDANSGTFAGGSGYSFRAGKSYCLQLFEENGDGTNDVYWEFTVPYAERNAPDFSFIAQVGNISFENKGKIVISTDSNKLYHEIIFAISDQTALRRFVITEYLDEEFTVLKPGGLFMAFTTDSVADSDFKYESMKISDKTTWKTIPIGDPFAEASGFEIDRLTGSAIKYTFSHMFYINAYCKITAWDSLGNIGEVLVKVVGLNDVNETAEP